MNYLEGVIKYLKYVNYILCFVINIVELIRKDDKWNGYD